MNQNQPTPHPPPPPVYIASLTVDNVKCFKGKQTIDLSDGNGKPALWTVILGNNNTGKTTLLKHLVAYYATENRPIIYGYGTARRMAPNSLAETDNPEATATLFSEEATLNGL